MTWAEPASASATSPRAYFETDSTLPSSCHTASGASSTAATGSTTGSSGRYSMSMSVRGVAGGLPVGRHDDGQHVAQVGGAAAFGDEHRPVLVDDADPQLAGHIGAGEHRLHAVDGQRGGTVDAQHVGPGVVGKAHRGRAGSPRAPCRRCRGGSRRPGRWPRSGCPGCADDAGLLQGGFLAVGQILHGVEDLDVAGAAAEVAAEVARGLLAAQVGALAVDEGLGPHQDAGDAEAALQGAVVGEDAGVAVPLGGVEALQGHDRGAPPPCRGAPGRPPGRGRSAARRSSRTDRWASSRPWAT